MGISKVTLDGTTLMDLTGVTVTAEHLDKNETAHDNKGDAITGDARPNYENDLLNHSYSGAYENDEITTIGERAFNADTALTSVFCPNVETLGSYVFNGCTNLENISFSKITKIPAYAFNGCSKLENINSDYVNTIGQYAFQNCTSLKSISFPALTGKTTASNDQLGACAFQGCTSLISAFFPNAIYLRNQWGCFTGCTALQLVSFPELTAYYGTGFFDGCTSLECVVLPKLSGNNANYQISTNWFRNCTSLLVFDVLNPYNIANGAFQNASAMSILIIRGASRTTSLGNINAFTGTPFAEEGIGGTLYVPQSKISDYENATNWSTILGYENNQIKAIEGSEYENYYADGTAIEGVSE